MHFADTGLCAHLAGWSSVEAIELGAMSGQLFETYAFGEIYKSHVNSGRRPFLYCFRTNDKEKIDLLLEQNGAVFPIEIKKTASPMPRDTKSFTALGPVSTDNVPDELRSLKREIGTSCVVCMAGDTYPIGEQTWAFPVWAI